MLNPPPHNPPSRRARRIAIRGVVQGVGFRPFVFRLAETHHIRGWVLNGSAGVDIHAEGDDRPVEAFERALRTEAPPAARIASMIVQDAPYAAFADFEIRASVAGRPTVRVTPDLPVCDACLADLRNPADRRSGYPYINCTNCGPRYSIIRSVPYDRARTTMAPWPMCAACARDYADVGDRWFHAQPVACAGCGPHYRLTGAEGLLDAGAVAAAARLLREGQIVAIKGIGGYHLACDARQPSAVAALRARKFRKERPFAILVEDVEGLRTLIDASPAAQALAESAARPIVLAPARVTLPGVAPDNADLGVMLPYTPVHHMLFAAGAPGALVMTSGNRSSEPIVVDDAEAVARLGEIADALLVGERPIARRVDDSVVQDGPFGPVIVRRSRGFAPGAVARLPSARPILAVGADLKNTVTLVVDGTAFVSQHIGDLDHHAALTSFDDTVADLLGIYAIEAADLLVVHDRHPEYHSTGRAGALGVRRLAVQHHRAHIASVLAERDALDAHVIGVAFDGTGYGDDGSIWGGEVFAGSVSRGLSRVAHLRTALLPGGDAAARLPAQAAAGFLADVGAAADLMDAPFHLPPQYRAARRLIDAGIRTFTTSSVGRLFDAVAALLGFTRPVTFEGQAAIWLEHLARRSTTTRALPFPCADGEIDYREALAKIVSSRREGQDPCEIARAFHRGLAIAVARLTGDLARVRGADAVVLSGGVFQNRLLLQDLAELYDGVSVPVWTNHEVPPNDGGISLGQAAIAATLLTAAND
ncbi:MAG: carbamoyltransferase HypF [Acidobacteriota bacterium]